MVNAVLRKLAGASPSQDSDGGKAESTLEFTHPTWMVERWTRFFGADATRDICAHGQEQPAAVIRVEGPRVEEEPAKAGIGLEPGKLLRAARVVTAGDVTETAAFREGRVRLQDEGSQLVAEMAGCGARILDCCAAPGGKTAILAENNPQAEITACDISEARLNAMRRSFARDPLTAKIHCVHADASDLPFRNDFDLILCDVPCSGTGTLARNPEIKLRLAVSDLRRQQERQIAILRSAYRVLAPGGRLVYSTCSLEAEENAMVVQALLAAEPTARLLDMGKRLEAMQAEGSLHPRGVQLLRESALREAYLQTVPGLLPCDGFFAAILTR